MVGRDDMKLVKARVKKFRNYVDSEIVEMEDSITSLVGKNESGKSAFLKALCSIKPDTLNETNIEVISDYPRWLKVSDGRKMDLDKVPFVEAYFSLNDNDLNSLSELLNTAIPKNLQLYIERSYSGQLKAKLVSIDGLEVSKDNWVESLLESNILEDELKDIIDSKEPGIIIEKINLIKEEKNQIISKLNTQKDSKNGDLGDCNKKIQEQSPEDDLNKINEKISKINGEINQINNEINQTNQEIDKLNKVINSVENIEQTISGNLLDENIDDIKDMLPTFFYYDSYSTLEGIINLDLLIQKPELDRTKKDKTALALLKLVGVTADQLMDTKYEFRKSELESAAIAVTQRVLTYWTQNEDINVDLDTDAEIINGNRVAHRFLNVRLRDQRHHTTNFSTRSTGFQWFFSFIVAFSYFEDQENIIILLDEPGLGLHGKAQEDLLKFIEEELANGRQVIYTNHSPFMVNPKRLDRVRLVEDDLTKKDMYLGAKISSEVLNVKRPETIFPLQAALGYDIAQNLFIGPYNLVVEGPSDYLYLDLISEFMKDKGMTSLNEKIVIVPVGGADKIPTFIALLGTHLDVSVLVDSDMKYNQKIQDMIKAGLLEKQRFITAGEITNHGSASIEDLFSIEEFLHLYNIAFNSSISPNDLTGTDSIVKRIERFTDKEFNHYKPLQVLQKNPDKLNNLSDETLENFEKLFEKLNKTFDS